jgi:DNA-binding MarR family transcriptional regulator
MKAKEKALYDLIRQVRTCFNQLKTLAEQLHQDLGINPSMRAVMEALTLGGRMTVPEIAQSRGVSRQHIQNIMNALLADGFVAAFDNPAHKRSPHFALTEKGEQAFATIKVREKEPLKRLAATMTAESLTCAGAALADLNRQIADEIGKGETHGNHPS